MKKLLIHGRNHTVSHIATCCPNSDLAILEGTVLADMAVQLAGQSHQLCTKQGKNLIDIHKGDCYAVKVTYEINENAIVIRPTINDAGVTKYLKLNHGFAVTPNLDYTISMERDELENIKFRLFNQAGKAVTPNIFGKSGTFNAGNNERLYLYLYLPLNATTDQPVTFWSIQLEQSKSSTEYQPFIPDSPSVEYPAPVQSAQNVALQIGERRVNLGITLRRIGEIADSYDSGTGNYTQRISSDADTCTTRRLDESGTEYLLPQPVTTMLSPVSLQSQPYRTQLQAFGDGQVKPVITKAVFKKIGRLSGRV